MTREGFEKPTEEKNADIIYAEAESRGDLGGGEDLMNRIGNFYKDKKWNFTPQITEDGHEIDSDLSGELTIKYYFNQDVDKGKCVIIVEDKTGKNRELVSRFTGLAFRDYSDAKRWLRDNYAKIKKPE